MRVRDQRREAAIERMADHVLVQGLAGASLRPLAAAVGTSDRMLLYYFADRHELLAATLQRVAARLTALLDAAFPSGTRLTFDALLPAVWNIVGSPELRPYMRLWLEIAAAASRDRQPERAIASGIVEGFASWVRNHLGETHDDARGPELLLATIEGLLFLDSVGRHDIAEIAVGAAIVHKLDCEHQSDHNCECVPLNVRAATA